MAGGFDFSLSVTRRTWIKILCREATYVGVGLRRTPLPRGRPTGGSEKSTCRETSDKAIAVTQASYVMAGISVMAIEKERIDGFKIQRESSMFAIA